MHKKKTARWQLNPEEVSWGMNSSSSGKTGQFERKMKTTRCTLFMTHQPTGIRVEGEIPAGHYSKKEMQQKRDALMQTLFQALERLVAKRLKIRGR